MKDHEFCLDSKRGREYSTSQQEPSMQFKDAVAKLETFGISGVNIYLIDLLPLIDLMWADGRIQENEKIIFDVYTENRIDDLNKSFEGAIRLSKDSVMEFFTPYLETRPSPELMKGIGEILNAVLMSSSDQAWSTKVRSSLLATALDIASSNVATYPYKSDERFSLKEKECFFALVQNLGN